MKRIKLNHLYIFSFFIMIIMPIIGNIILDNTITDESENRIAISKPDLNIKNIKAFPKEYEAYYNDNFSFRSNLVRINNLLKVKILKTSPKADVLVGKNDWYYYTGNDSMKAYQGLMKLNDEELDLVVENIKERKEWLEKQDIKYMLVIAPDKQTVYPEYLPNNIKKVVDTTRTDQILARIRKETDINILDLRETILKNKDKGLLYYKTDTHWNELGAYYGYQAIINELSLYYPGMKPYSLEHYSRKMKRESGDIVTNMLNLKKYIYEDVVYLEKKKYESINVEAYNRPNDNVNILKYKNNNDNLPKLLMFRDSFSTSLVDNISEHFSNSTYIWDHKFDSELIKNEKPDIVIHEMVERFAPGALLLGNSEEVKK